MPSSPLLAGLGRGLIGLGAAFGFVGAVYVVNHHFAPERFAVRLGLVNAVGMLGTAVGAVMLSDVIVARGWQTVFGATSAAGRALFLLALWFLRDTPEAARPAGDLLSPLRRVVADGRVWLIAMIGALVYMPVNVFGGLWRQQEMIAEHGLTPVQAETAASAIYWGMAIGSIAAGALGGLFGGGQMLTFTMAKEGQSAAISGSIIAFVNMIGVGGALVFQPLIGYLVDLDDGRFGVALTTSPPCLPFASILGLFVREERHPDHVSEPKTSGTHGG